MKLCGPERAEVVHELTQAAFKQYAGHLDPPSGVMRETLESVRRDLERHGGAVAWIGDTPAGCLRFDVQPDHLHVRRVAVAPDQQRKGVGTALMAWSHGHARTLGLPEVRIGVREQLPGNRTFYEGLGYIVVARHRHPETGNAFWSEMRLKV